MSNRFFILLFILMISANFMFAQAPLGELMSYKLISGGDTVKLDRKYGTWWYGIQGGGQLNSYFGDLNVSTLKQKDNPFNRNTSFNSGFGGGYFVGGLIEWKQRGEKWGAILNVSIFDQRSFNSNATERNDSTFKLNANFQHIVLSPAAKYHLPIEGLHLTGGLNLEIMMNNSGSQNLNFENVNQSFSVGFDKPSFGYGANIGFGYDIFVADFNYKSRVLLTPFADINIRSSIINDNSSAFYSASFRFGFAMKIGSDDILQDTLLFDSTHIPPPQYFASARSGEGVDFTAYTAIEDRPSGFINVIKKSEVSAEVGEVVVDKIDTNKQVAAQAPPQKPKVVKEQQIARTKEIVIQKGIAEKMSFPSSASVQVTPEMKIYLNKVAEYMLSNPNARIIIIGHSDNRGTIEQRTVRARERAKNVEKYLLKELNIPQHRVIASWKGALFAIATNDTEEGRQQNRRVEITIEE